jgi:endoglucanase
MRFACLLYFIILFLLPRCSKSSSAPGIELGSLTENFPAAGGSREITVGTKAAWSVSDTSSWCVATAGTGVFTLLVQPNVDTVERRTAIIITSGNTRKELMLVQAGATPVDPNAGIVPDSIAPDATGMRDISPLLLAREMVPGWNAGNSLDAIGGETAWGNPPISQKLIDSVKEAGFRSIRLPIAWSKFSNATTFEIDTNWMRRVEAVVNYALNRDLYVLMNIHWDGGWMQPTNARKDYVNNRLRIMWKQIAKRFRNYNDHLLFAGTNEVMVDGDYGTPTAEYYNAQNSFNQTFISTVRATGGRNAHRNLVVQGFNTNIDHTVNFFQLPTDPRANRMMVEVHYYDPFNFTLNENSNITQWGATATDPAKTETWANEAWTDAQFLKMKTAFIDKGYPVILGEYGAIARTSLGSPEANAEHAKYRTLYMQYVTRSIRLHGLVPMYWDNGPTGDKSMGLFNRATGEKIYPEIISVITANN